METVTPKVHQHRHRRGESRQRQRRPENQQQQFAEGDTKQQESESKSKPKQEEKQKQQQEQEEEQEQEQGNEYQFVSESESKSQSHSQSQSQSQQDTVATGAPTGFTSLSCEDIVDADEAIIENRSIRGISRAASTGTTHSSTISQSSSQQTILLINGVAPPTMEIERENLDPVAVVVVETNETRDITFEEEENVEIAEKTNDEIQSTQAGGAALDGNSGHNSSGDAQSLRETLEQLRPPKRTSGGGCGGVGVGSGGGGGSNSGISGIENVLAGGNHTVSGITSSAGQQHRPHHHHHHHHHHHRERDRDRDRQHRTRSPRETSASGSTNSNVGVASGVLGASTGERVGVGILGFMEREIRQCSPTPSTARSRGTGINVGTGTGTGTGTASGTGTGLRKLPSSLSDDPQASPAQRSIRSRSSLEKSPRRKRSKSESRRRRERKLIAAGEMEVRQANETLMRYLKQCSEMNDASLSGELEIDQSYDERRVHRKTKSQRDKRGHLISKLYTAGGGLSSLLKELSDDIVPAEGEEIYNPFTPVVSPTEDNAPAHIDKMFMQTSSGYRPIERCYYKHHHHHHVANAGSGTGTGTGDGGVGGAGVGGAGVGGAGGSGIGIGTNNIAGSRNGSNNGTGGMSIGGGIAVLIGPSARERHFRGSSFCSGGGGGRGGVNIPGAVTNLDGLRRNESYTDDVHCLLEADECNSHGIRTNIQLACVVQRIWLLVANICHGLLAGLALAHLLFVISSPQPMDWAKVFVAQMNPAAGDGTTTSDGTTSTTSNSISGNDAIGIGIGNGNGNDTGEFSGSSLVTSATISHETITNYASFAGIYLNTFYCLAIVCLVSVLDRMDICRWDLTNASEFISFRWLIIAMIYIATIILTICSDTIDEKLYYNNNMNVTLTEKELLSNSILNIWSSLSVTRSISAICGWIMIGLTPHEDLLYEHLVDLTKYQLSHN